MLALSYMYIQNLLLVADFPDHFPRFHVPVAPFEVTKLFYSVAKNIFYNKDDLIPGYISSHSTK